MHDFQPIQQDIRLTFRYAVQFTTGAFDPTNPVLRDVIAAGTAHHAEPGGRTLPSADCDQAPSKVLFVIDEGVHRHHPGLRDAVDAYAVAHADVLTITVPTVVLPGGEAVKASPRHAEALLQAIHDAALCRHSYLIAIGGGALLDVAGYAAATAHRGIRLVRLPTTVLAQDDSGVGVKNGVNAFGKKNYLGTFAPPFAVINDFAFLTTLADRDWLGGISEAIKAALIRDAAFFDAVERDADALVARDLPAMRRLIHRCAELHVAHIAGGGDPFELGSSRPLDFGHWAAHKLEQVTRYALRHGEAVAIGLALDCTYAYLVGLLAEADWRRITALLARLRLPVYHAAMARHLDTPAHPESLLRGLEEFREHLGGRLTVTLLRGVGQAVDVHEIDRDVMRRAVGVLANCANCASVAKPGETTVATTTLATSEEDRHERTIEPEPITAH